MQKKFVPALRRNMVLFLVLLVSYSLNAQERYTVKIDPKNPKRRIIEMKPIKRIATVSKPTINALDAGKIKRPAIAFKAFEMKDPRNEKALDPNKVVTITMPDGKVRKTTVKKYFDELNALESALAAKGRTLRIPATFVDLKPQLSFNSYNKAPKLANGYYTKTLKFNPRSGSTGTGNRGKRPVVTNGNINNVNSIGSVNPASTPGTERPSRNTGSTTDNTNMIFNWNANLYIAARFTNHGSPEFPVEWVKSTWTNTGRSIFPVIVQVPKAIAAQIKRIDWQVSEKEFTNTLKEINVPGIKKTGSMNPVTWEISVRGTSALPKHDLSRYAALYIDFEQIKPVPQGSNTSYYIRTICYNQAGEVMKISSQVVANYGFIPQKFKIAVQEQHMVPGFNYQYPEAGVDLPFGVFIRGMGFNSKKATAYQDENYDPLVTTGYRLSANAGIGVKYFNFLSIVDSKQPIANDLTILDATFTAAVGLGTGQGNTNEDQGATLKVDFLNKLYTLDYPLTMRVPGIPEAISLEYDLKQDIDIGLLDMWFMLGPIPVHIAAGIKGQTGIRFFGQANTKPPFEMTGGVTPFLESEFNATGGVDALVAYATLNAKVDPLFSLTMPLTFNSNADKPLSFSSNLSALKGRVFLKVGFWYPCPDLKKIVGWLAGGEDTPLCECTWEYNIFDFPGYDHAYGY